MLETHEDSTRKGDWIQTFTGVAFYPLDPRPNEIHIRDIAHALSMQCRYGGHARYFYSVAEHCILLSQAVPPELALAALMHDAAEAYLVDVPRPIKSSLTGYREIEAVLEASIAMRFSLADPCPALVKEYDTRILNNERSALMSPAPREWLPCGDPLPGVRIIGLQQARAETMFLRRFEELNGEARDIVTVEPPAPAPEPRPLPFKGVTREEAVGHGYTGNQCDHCGSMAMQVAGHCEVCADCGTTTGCS